MRFLEEIGCRTSLSGVGLSAAADINFKSIFLDQAD
jgi:hypothetical protein